MRRLLTALILLPLPALAARTCATHEHHQFDFWIGKWTVTETKTGKLAGASLIESLYGGCALRENWTEPGYAGGSLNLYSDADHQWHQTWTDSAGTWREFLGGMQAGKMVLVWKHPSAKSAGRTVQERMIFTPNPDSSVRQYSDQTIDGAHWTERYDYTYRRAR